MEVALHCIRLGRFNVVLGEDAIGQVFRLADDGLWYVRVHHLLVGSGIRSFSLAASRAFAAVKEAA